MQNAPSVEYPAGRSALHARVLTTLALLGGAGLAAGWWHSFVISPSNTAHARWVLGIAGWVIWGLWARGGYLRAQAGWLKWDAQAAAPNTESRAGAWLWLDQMGAEGRSQVLPELVFDGQRHLLLRLTTEQGVRRWLWLECAAQPTRWDDLRRALHASQ